MSTSETLRSQSQSSYESETDEFTEETDGTLTIGRQELSKPPVGRTSKSKSRPVKVAQPKPRTRIATKTTTNKALRVQLEQMHDKLQELRRKHKNLKDKLRRREGRIEQITQNKCNEDGKTSKPRNNVRVQNPCQQNKTKELQSLLRHRDTRIETLERALQACRDDVFRLQPIPQSTDNEIQEQYEKLCQRIEIWVEEGISEYEHEKQNTVPYTQVIEDGGNKHAKALLEKTPEIGEHLLVAMIHSEIVNKLFGEDVVLFGLDHDSEEFFRDIEENMAQSNQERDPSTIRAWRSDTLQALTRLSWFKKDREQALQDFTHNLFEILHRVFPPLSTENRRRLQLDVTRHAADLEANIHFSFTGYKLENVEMLEEYLPLKREDLAWRTWVDVESRKILRANSELTADNDGVVGMMLLQIEPALDRIDQDGEVIVLRPAKCLLKLHAPLPKQRRK